MMFETFMSRLRIRLDMEFPTLAVRMDHDEELGYPRETIRVRWEREGSTLDLAEYRVSEEDFRRYDSGVLFVRHDPNRRSRLVLVDRIVAELRDQINNKLFEMR